MRYIPQKDPYIWDTVFDQPPTKKQQAFLDRHNLAKDEKVDFYQAKERIGLYIDKRRQLAPTPQQEHILRKAGLWRPGITRGEAFDFIGRYFEAQKEGQQESGNCPRH